MSEFTAEQADRCDAWQHADTISARRSDRVRPLFGVVAAAVLIMGCAHSNTDPALTTAPSTGAETTAAIQSKTTSRVLLDKQLVSDFRQRVDGYMKLHHKLAKEETRQKGRNDVGENLVSQKALAMRIGYARHNARPGDLFTPPIAMALRRAMDPELRGRGALTTRESIRDDAPEIFVLVVNGEYPAGASRSTMPANVLKILPVLPVGLEYRIVDTHLILMDLEANIVVDYIVDVMCKTC